MTQNTFENAERPDDDASDKTPTRYLDLVYVFSVDPHYVQLMVDRLCHYDHEVIGFSDFDEFRSAITVRAPAAVVLDIDSDSGLLAKDAMTAGGVTNFPVIYLSSNDNFEDRLHAVRDGAEGYFIKPIDVQALSVRIDEKIAQNAVRSYRVLVVDDDEFFLSFFDAVLSSAGMHVKALIDPTQILDAIKKFKPELILTDLYMPQCNGIEMAKVIRQNNHYLDIPIVFLSSETEMQKQLGALETGADEFLTKPIDPEKLISSIAIRAERYRNLRKKI